MQRTVLFCRHKIKREFVISSKTKPQNLKTLLKKALNLQSEIKTFKYQDCPYNIVEIIKNPQPEYSVVLEDDSDEERSRSDVCSQKNMSKVSGRNNPPSEKELLDSKFYIDDFQLFMTEISGEKANRLFGIVFFNNRKKASFLGKKILRELVFQFDQIEFFYALHPIKMHTSSALLGEVLAFSLFRGKKMIHERQFPEQITAADEILQYIKNLVKLGEVDFNPVEPKRTKNLIHVQEQRSFDHKIQNSPEKLSDFGARPNRTTQNIKVKPITPDKEPKNRTIFTFPKPESPSKSHITNQISFENDLYQPDWFSQGTALTRLEKSILSALIKSSDSNILSFIQGLSLKASSRQQLNIKLVKVFLNEVIDEKFKQFSEKQRGIIENNQQNRKSFVFNALLKLFKFGDMKEFMETLRKGVRVEQTLTRYIKFGQINSPPFMNLSPTLQSPASLMVNYSSIAKNNDKNKTGFTIKLQDCQNDNGYEQESISPFRQGSKLRLEHVKIAALFHKKPLKKVSAHILKDVEFSPNFSEAEKAGIQDLILKNDAFMIESFIKNPEKKKHERMPSKTVRKYLFSVESRYDQVRQRTVVDTNMHIKMQKLQIFHGLVYYLYKLRRINKKQLKISFYLYTWSDLNILGAFQLYLADRSLEELVDTIYSIDYNYYLNNLYEIHHSEVVQFTPEIQSQLIILFLYEDRINSGEERISLQKFIKVGDNSLLKLYGDVSINQTNFVAQMLELGRAKNAVLQNLENNDTYHQTKDIEKKKYRCSFLDQIVRARYKDFTKKDLVKYCINNNEPEISNMFDRLDENNQQQEWVDSFNLYIQKIDAIHMDLVLKQLCQEGGLAEQKLLECKQEVIKGIYEAYMQTNDRADTIDSLERSFRKNIKSPVK